MCLWGEGGGGRGVGYHPIENFCGCCSKAFLLSLGALGIVVLPGPLRYCFITTYSLSIDIIVTCLGTNNIYYSKFYIQLKF